jgi:hypothetical protein
MENALLETAANQFVESYGPAALSVLQERADCAEARGNRVAAKTWRGIAAAVSVRCSHQQTLRRKLGRSERMLCL